VVADTQRSSLERLDADIAGRRFSTPLLPEQVLRADQVVASAIDPGPGLAPEGEEVGAWWSAFITRSSGRASLLPAELARDSTTSGIATGSPMANTTFAASAAVPALAIPIKGIMSVSSCFGWRPLRGGPDLHDGIDFPGSDEEILAAADGMVFGVCDASRSPACDGPSGMRVGDFGNTVIIQHTSGLFTRYSHLSSVAVDVTRAARVRQGGVDSPGVCPPSRGAGYHTRRGGLMAGVEIDRGRGDIVIASEWRERELCKEVPGCRWDRTSRVWRVPLSWSTCLALRGIFRDDLAVGPDLDAWARSERDGRVGPALALRGARDVESWAESLPDLYPFQRAGAAF